MRSLIFRQQKRRSKERLFIVFILGVYLFATALPLQEEQNGEENDADDVGRCPRIDHA